MKEEIKKEQQNGRELKAKDNKKFGRGNSPNNRRDRSRSPVERRKDASSKAQRRVYVANVAFDTHWSDLKDLFRDKVGNVTYCQLFEDEEGRSRGCGLVEFQDANSAKKAIDELHRFNYKGRELVVKEDIDCERDRYGRLIPNKKEKERETQRDVDRRDRLIYDSRQGFSAYNTYGLSPQFLESLGITGPLNNRIFVANLDYKVGEKKLEEIFRLAGKVLRVRLYTDQQGTSKGHGTVEFEHPVEAVQAISMFHDQNLYARPMSIRMDKYETEEMPEVLPSKLPSGLEGIGKGLGVGGQPLNISKSLLNASLAQQPVVTQQTAPQVAAIPAQSLAAPTQSQVSSYNISGLTSALGQQTVGLNPSMPSAQVNQAINSGLNSLGLGNLSSSSLTASLSNQNLNQLANTAQNVLAAAASLGGTSLNPALGLTSTQAQNNLFSSYERDFGADKFRNGATNQPSNNAGQGVDTILVRNLPPSFSWQNLRDRFNEIGEVRFAELKNRGMAVVRFQNIRDAQRAVELMNGIRIDNKPIEVGLYY